MDEIKALEPWKTDSFSIEAGASGTYDELFANGLMQVRITVSIEAHQLDTDTGSNVDYTIPPHEWGSLELQLAGGRPLPAAWNASYTENDFVHQMPSGRSRPDQAETARQEMGDRRPGRGKLNFLDVWLTTTKVETQNLRARIKDGSGEWVSTEDSGNFSTVTIKAHPPQEYTPAKLQIETDTDSGPWWITYDGVPDPVEAKWHATIYYVYPGVYPLQKANVSWTREDTQHPRMVLFAEDDGYAVATAAWNLGDPTKEIVQYQKVYTGIATLDYTADLTVNERDGVPCFAHVRFDKSVPDLSEVYNLGEMWFQFWDIYGNQGSFYPALSGDKNGIEFHIKT
ncbi:hypothetical protein BDV19DRAFT_395401 [Aspergillus venezuelensis]